MDMLGSTIEQITNEKAGIIKNNIPVIVGKVEEKAYNIISNVSKGKSSSLHSYLKGNYRTDLIGEHQQWNTLVWL